MGGLSIFIMLAKIFLFSNTKGEINNFLEKFFSKKIELAQSLYWQKDFSNPIELSEFIAAFIDNIEDFNIFMWISLDKDIFIKVSPQNADTLIKYLFERYPY